MERNDTYLIFYVYRIISHRRWQLLYLGSSRYFKKIKNCLLFEVEGKTRAFLIYFITISDDHFWLRNYLMA